MKKFLKDEVSNIILTNADYKEYVASIISKVIKIDKEILMDTLELDTPRVNENVNIKYSTVDAKYNAKDMVINIEVNIYNTNETLGKNFRYVCHLALEQIKIGEKDKFNKIYQININAFDLFKQNKFIYYSSIMEESLHQKRNDYISIIDINMDFLSHLDYNVIEEEKDSLESLLYIFICEDKEIREKLYSESELMEKVNAKLNELTGDFSDGLYYDKEAYINQVSKEVGIEVGHEEKAKEIAKKMLNKNYDYNEIFELTGLTEEEIEELKKEIN